MAVLRVARRFGQSMSEDEGRNWTYVIYSKDPETDRKTMERLPTDQFVTTDEAGVLARWKQGYEDPIEILAPGRWLHVVQIDL